jgi:hypothetical protein
VKAIYNTKFFMRSSTVSLAQFHADYTEEYGQVFTYTALRNHVKKHQFMSEKDFNSRHLRQIANNAEKQIVKSQLESSQVWDKVIALGMDQLTNGDITMKTSDLLKAAKDKSDFDLKTKDQQIAVAEMMWHFASGENETNNRTPYDKRVIEGETATDFDPAAGIAEDSQTSPTGPGNIYYPPAWDAAPSRPS